MIGISKFVPSQSATIANCLASLSKRESTEDPYMTSPAYIAMTGRKGLSIYEGQIENIFYAPHPNKYSSGIIFPPRNLNALNDIKNLTNLIKKSYKTIELIRVPVGSAPTWGSILKGNVLIEDILDYTYPVYTIDNLDLLNLKGPKFYNFKKTLNKLNTKNIKIYPINFKDDKKDLILILRQWLSLVGFEHTTNPIEPAIFVINELSALFDLTGFIVYLDNNPVGFTIWENPTNQNKTANAIIHCALHIKGLSELIHFKMAEIILETGIPNLCIGGAENKGLDAFKRKMNPKLSTILKTIEL